MVPPIQIIAEVNHSLSSTGDVNANIRAALEALASSLGAGYAFFAVCDPDDNSLHIGESARLSVSDFRRIEAHIDSEALHEVLVSETTGLFNPATFTPLAGESVMPENVVLAVSAKSASKTTGIVALSLKKSADFDEIKKIILIVGSMFAQVLRIEHAVRGERERLREENLHLKQELKEKYDFSHIVGNSNPIKHVYEQVTQVAKSNATVLLRGESGTGKELIANAIHYNSLRSKKPFIKINCAAIPETLIESELFGHEKGAFTGADRLKKGRFELAEGGTLFLDEIGDLPLQTQIKLLRVLQEREFERIGGIETIKANIRLVTATNKNLENAISEGSFREDLYYRLNVFSIFLPPLRERKSDILLLAEHFLEKYEIEHNKRIRRISTPAIDMLMSYHFPGNVRELENAIERAVLVCDTNVIHGHHLPPTLQTAEVSGTVTDLSLASAVEAFERAMIQDALKSNKGNIAKTARTLDSTERILGYKIKKYGIDTMRFRK
ncbi:MAG: sigma-54 interaction domain-containing protein [Pyrinomonadaceae bacterium]